MVLCLVPWTTTLTLPMFWIVATTQCHICSMMLHCRWLHSLIHPSPSREGPMSDDDDIRGRLESFLSQATEALSRLTTPSSTAPSTAILRVPPRPPSPPHRYKRRERSHSPSSPAPPQRYRSRSRSRSSRSTAQPPHHKPPFHVLVKGLNTPPPAVTVTRFGPPIGSGPVSYNPVPKASLRPHRRHHTHDSDDHHQYTDPHRPVSKIRSRPQHASSSSTTHTHDNQHNHEDGGAIDIPDDLSEPRFPGHDTNDHEYEPSEQAEYEEDDDGEPWTPTTHDAELPPHTHQTTTTTAYMR